VSIVLSRTDEALEHLRLASESAGLNIGETVVPTDHHIVVDGSGFTTLTGAGASARRCSSFTAGA